MFQYEWDEDYTKSSENILIIPKDSMISKIILTKVHCEPATWRDQIPLTSFLSEVMEREHAVH